MFWWYIPPRKLTLNVFYSLAHHKFAYHSSYSGRSGSLLKLEWIIKPRACSVKCSVRGHPYTNYYTRRTSDLRDWSCKTAPRLWSGAWKAETPHNASIRLSTMLNYCHLDEPSVLSAGCLGCWTLWWPAAVLGWKRYGVLKADAAVTPY